MRPIAPRGRTGHGQWAKRPMRRKSLTYSHMGAILRITPPKRACLTQLPLTEVREYRRGQALGPSSQFTSGCGTDQKTKRPPMVGAKLLLWRYGTPGP